MQLSSIRKTKINRIMAEYALTLSSDRDYRIIKKLLKAFDGASIRPVGKRLSGLEKSIMEAQTGQVSGPFKSVKELMDDLIIPIYSKKS